MYRFRYFVLTKDDIVEDGVEDRLELLAGDLVEDGEGPHGVQPHVLGQRVRHVLQPRRHVVQQPRVLHRRVVERGEGHHECRHVLRPHLRVSVHTLAAVPAAMSDEVLRY